MMLMSLGVTAQWQWQNPLPQGNSVYSMSFPDASTGYAAGAWGTILKSTDGGLTWDSLSTGTDQWFSSIHFINNTTGVAVGGWDGNVWQTNDGGLTWNTMSYGYPVYLSSVFLYDSFWWYILEGGNTIYRSVNGGLTWSIFPVNLFGADCNDLFFVSNTTGFTAGGDGKIMKTTDGAVTWNFQSSGTTEDLYSIAFTDAVTGFAAGKSGTIIRTTNGGTNWTPATSGTTETIRDLCFPGGNTGYAAGSHGTVLKTTDLGVTWTPLATGTTLDLFAVAFTDADHGTAGGMYGTLLSTADGGATWLPLTSGPRDSLFCVDFPSGNVGYTAGKQGLVMKTSDGGTTWDILPPPTAENILSILFTSPVTGYLSGKNGTLMKTTDGAGSWSPLAPGTAENLTCLWFTAPDTGYVSGSSGSILKTTNAGLTWTPLPTGTLFPIRTMFFVDKNIGYAAAGDPANSAGGFVLKTIDGGDTWDSLSTGGGSPSSLWFKDADHGFMVYYSCIVYKTDDGGVTWDSLCNLTSTEIEPMLLTDIHFIDDTTGFITGEAMTVPGTLLGPFMYGGVSYKTTDGGMTWNWEETFTQNGLKAVTCSEEGKWYAVGAGGTILNQGGGVINAIANLQPDADFVLYPNPASGRVTITPGPEMSGRLRVTLSDAKGAILMIMPAQSGRSTAIDLRGLPAGVYFVTVQGKSGASTRKVVVKD